MKLKNLLLTSVLILNYTIHAQTDEQRAEIKKDINMSELNLLKSKFQAQFEMDEAKVVTYLAANPLVKRTETKNGAVFYIKSIDENGKPVYNTTYSNIASGQMIKANSLYSGGSIGANITGTGMVVGVWDGGTVRASHELLSGKATMQINQSLDDAIDGGNNHMTHVTGTIVGKELPSTNPNSNARGIAYNATAQCYDWNNDIAEMTAFAASGGLVSNHSYGMGGNVAGTPVWEFGAYSDSSKNVDELCKNAPNYLPFYAAGNDQSPNANTGKTGALQGYDMITRGGGSKNAISVGSVGLITIDPNGVNPPVFTERAMSSYSNFGPTDDGRIKPDICARGTNINSAYATSDTAYSEIQGTSMASPAAAASALLLQQYYYSLNNSYMSASMLKCLLLHSADDEGTPGPDAKFGWGILNIERAAQIIKDAKTTGKARMHTFTTNPTNDGQDEVSIFGNGTTSVTPGVQAGTTDLRASICWTDNEGVEQTSANGVDPTTSRLVYNFDMLFRRDGTSFATRWPFIQLTAANPTATLTAGTNWFQNNADNYRQANIPAGGALGEQYVVYIKKSNSSPAAVRNISAIVTGLAQSPALSTDDFESNAKYVFYSQTDNKLKLISNEVNVLGNYKVYDINGKLLQKGQSNTNEIELNFNTKGVFVAVFENETWKQSLKFIK